MDLKFSFGGASHDHGGAPSAPAVSYSSELNVAVRIDRSGDAPAVLAEVITGDGVTYSRGERACDADSVVDLARATRSAIARAVAGLEGPLANSITGIRLEFPGGEAVLGEFGIGGTTPAVSEALQARLGVNAGVPVHVAG